MLRENDKQINQMVWYLNGKKLGVKDTLYHTLLNRGNVAFIHSRDLFTHVGLRQGDLFCINFGRFLDNPGELVDTKLCFHSPCHVYIGIV